jgi:hypothetical protein
MAQATLKPMRPRAITSVIAAAILLVDPAAGCAAAGGNPALGDRSRLANDLAARLGEAAKVTYTATYTLPGRASATIAQAQQPARTALLYPGGKLVLDPSGSMDCRQPAHGGTRCTISAPVSPSTDAVATLLGLVGNHGLVAPTQVVSLLGTAALDTNAAIKQRDATIAGENATCVDVTGGVAAFTACITASGVLGSFQGTVDGTAVNVTLDRYEDQVTPDAFAVPTGATVVDSRPK